MVTGGAGFVGRQAVQALLARGYEVHGMARDASAKFPGITLHAADALSASAIETVKRVRPSHLLLSAWVTEHGQYWSSPENSAWQRATVSLAEAFLAQGGTRIVFAGTCAEYDWNDRGALAQPLRESDAAGVPHTIYGRAKRDTAAMLADAARKTGASFVDGRIFFPIGIGEDRRRFLPTVINSLLAGKAAALGNPALIRDVMDVRDCGAAFAALVAGKSEGAVNIGSGEGISLGELAELAARKLGRLDLLQFNAIPARPDDPPQLVANVSRLYQETGFSPRYTLSETIDASIDCWRTQAH